MLKATANNALGFAFKLAIDSVPPEIGKVMDEFSQKAQLLNQMNISSCETAQALVGGIWPQMETTRATICEAVRSEEHTSELQSLMSNSYDVFCLKKTKHKNKLSRDENHNNNQNKHTKNKTKKHSD